MTFEVTAILLTDEVLNMKKLIFLISLFSILSTAHAANISGTWTGEANNYPFVLNITQNGSNITGTYTQPNTNVPVTQITGTVSPTAAGDKIVFKRSGKGSQTYTGYLSTTGVTISGYFQSYFAPTTYCCVPFSVDK